MLPSTKHTVKIIHTWAHVIIELKIIKFFFLHKPYIRIVFEIIYRFAHIDRSEFLFLVINKIFCLVEGAEGWTIFFNCNAYAHHYHLLRIHFRWISQRCFSIFEQSLHFTNFRLIISVCPYFFFHFIFIWVLLVITDCYSAISLITFRNEK